MSDPKRRVLIADDTPDLLISTRKRLVASGYEVTTATDGRSALDLVEATRPDAVVLDVVMPELNGFQVCRRIKQDPALAGIPVILLTGKDSAADRFWGESAGADAYLSKVGPPEDLVHTLTRLLG